MRPAHVEPYIDLIHDTSYICTHTGTGGINVLSRGFPGGKQVMKSANTGNRACIFLF